MTRSFDVFFDLRLNKRLSKQSWDWWFDTLLCPLWRHSNDKWAGNRRCSEESGVILFWGWRRNISGWLSHDGVIKRRHFPRYWPFVRGIHRWPVDSPHKGQWRGFLMFYLICVWINGWAKNWDAGDLRCRRAHYDVTVMKCHVRWCPMPGNQQPWYWMCAICQSPLASIRFQLHVYICRKKL